MSKNEIYFDLLQHRKVLSLKDTGWSKEVNIVSWRGGPARVDIREWDKNHERMGNGVVLSEADAKRLQEILKDKLPAQEKDFPHDSNEEWEGAFSAGDGFVPIRIFEHLGTVYTRPNGCKLEVTISSWNSCTPMVEIREWRGFGRPQRRGVKLTYGEAIELCSANVTYFPDIVDHAIDGVINYFLTRPSAKLERNAYDEIETRCEDGIMTLPLTLDGKKIEISCREVR